VVRETADPSGIARRQPRQPPATDGVDAGRSHRATSDGVGGDSPDGRATCPEPVTFGEGQIGQEDAYRARQEAGLADLAGIASRASMAMAEAVTAIIPVLPAWPPKQLDAKPSGASAGDSAASERVSPVRLLRGRLRADHLVRNSLYLMVSSGAQAGLGFAFWILMARLFSPQDVGKASSLLSATSLVAYFALAGLNTAVMRYLPTATNKDPLLTAVFVMVSGMACAIAVGYVILTPIVAPRLDFIAHSPLMAAGFALLAAATAVNVLTDSVFMASRRAELCAITDGFVGGVGKLVFGLILAGTGAYGLYLAAVGGFAAAAVASMVLIITILRWRPSFTSPLQTLKPLLKFSGANYLANAMNLLPSVLVPLIVLGRLGARPAGYYFVAFQIAAILYAAVAAVESSFMAEGSQAGTNWRAIRRRSRLLAIALFVPGGIVTAVAAHWLLLAFGSAYSLHGTASLEILAVAVLPIAACNWGWTVLRLTGRLRALVASTVIYGAGICGSAWVLAPHGLTALSSAWLVGSAVAAAASTVLAAAAKAPARHRRKSRLGPEADLTQH